MASFTSVGHVAIKCSNLDRSLAFYKKLGFDEILHLNYADGTLWLIYLRVSDTQFLELFPDGEGTTVPDRMATGVNHFCLTVDDLDGVLAMLDARGVELIRPLKVGSDGNRQAWIADPDGNRIEMMEMAPASIQYEAVKQLKSGSTRPVVMTAPQMPPLEPVR